jgi:hypothetical protein
VLGPAGLARCVHWDCACEGVVAGVLLMRFGESGVAGVERERAEGARRTGERAVVVAMRWASRAVLMQYIARHAGSRVRRN